MKKKKKKSNNNKINNIISYPEFDNYIHFGIFSFCLVWYMNMITRFT